MILLVVLDGSYYVLVLKIVHNASSGPLQLQITGISIEQTRVGLLSDMAGAFISTEVQKRSAG